MNSDELTKFMAEYDEAVRQRKEIQKRNTIRQGRVEKVEYTPELIDAIEKEKVYAKKFLEIHFLDSKEKA